MSTWTPWGKSQGAKHHARGIVEYSCAGHGGIHLSKTRNALVHSAFCEEAERFAPEGWYEEDVAFFIVVFTFPESFDADLVKRARAELKTWWPDAYTAATGEPVALGESRVLRERAAREANRDRYVAVSAFGDWHAGVPKGMVGVVAVRGGRPERGNYAKDAERSFLVPEADYRDKALASEIGFVVDESRHEAVDFLKAAASRERFSRDTW
jgi:hypothetical protein